MIREIELICAKCKNQFKAEGKIYFQETFNLTDFAKVQLWCANCHQEWHSYWQILAAEFFEEYGSVYVNIELKNGDKYPKIDCTALEDMVATQIEIPLAAQKELYHIYKRWYDEKMKDCLKTCTFVESFMRTSFSCETYGGDKYEDIAFRFNRLGVLETEREVPEVIQKQLIEKWNAYELRQAPLPKIDIE